MPAGNYRFHESQHILTVSQVGGARSVSIMTLPTSPKGELSKGVVEFNRYGDTYFLSGLWSPESAEGSAVIKGRQEKEIARRFGSAPAQTAALKTK